MKALFLLTFIATALLCHAQKISAARAKDSVGKTLTVCGPVTGVHATDKVTFINMDKKYPDNPFTVVVFAADVAKFSYQFSTLDGEDICVTGLIKDYKGKPEIVVTDEKQIQFQATKITPRQ